MLRHLTILSVAAIWFIAPASAQLPDNTTLKGAYNVRYLGALTDPADTAVSFSGTLTFDGASDTNGSGGFTVSSDSKGITAGAALKFRTSGKYRVLSSGMVIIENVFDPVASNVTTLYGGVGANGAIAASSTDGLYCDLFVAVPAATSASAATLTGTYRVGTLEFLNGDFLSTRDAFFSVNADGKGGLGDVSIAGTALNLKNVATTQTSPAATYTVTANGSGTLVLPLPSGTTAANALVSGTKTLYVSQDGSLFISGNPAGYDMQIGVKSGGSTSLDGLYWSAFLDNYQGSTDPNQNGLDSGPGSSVELAANNNLEIAHERINIDGFFSYEATYSDNFPFDSNGLEQNQGSTYAVGGNGQMAIGVGVGSDYFLSFYVKAPAMKAPSGTTVFLNPQGVVNAANSVPITHQVSPGEVITLVGTGIGPSTPVTASAPFPTGGLGGVQVMINGTAAPVYYASATQVAAVVPYSTPADGSLLTIQVVFNNTQSNAVRVYSGPSSPGLFTIPPGGPFDGAITHADGTVVTSANPAKVGETVAMYLTGLGAVSPAVTAGTAAPSSPLSQVVQSVSVLIDGVPAKIVFQGLAPTLGGLYQLNVTIPSGVTTGSSVDIEITTWLDNFQTPDTDNFEATIPIGK